MSRLMEEANLHSRVDLALRLVLNDLRNEAEQLDSAVVALVDQAARLLSRGKRLRAGFAYWSFRAHSADRAQNAATSSESSDPGVLLGAALELFQVAALFHDDVLDASDVRRGEPTAHRAFERRHREANWSGAAERFGVSAAILLGDLTSLAATQVADAAARSAGLEPGKQARVRDTFAEMGRTVMYGQYLDLLAQTVPWSADPSVDEARARAVLRAKSASYSVQYPVTLGARLAGAPETAVASIDAFGLPLGEAFQLRDDLLSLFGDPAITGKPAGDDLREGKRTVLICRALARTDSASRATLRAGLGREDLSADEVAHLTGIIAESGAVAEIEALIEGLVQAAADALAHCTLAEPGRHFLERLMIAATDRVE